ncbi:hypothetical protein H0264_35140 [Nocardia huaxiensis]|uniref:Uncharacterized protein n=1 Tax=Nocardia huaxiensis TaxID=2755382 RepID=A0A7D6VAD6_9NOCA|nr:hypothetical protein [Nocardia huaxiensis]QLY30311.1 hypothetical protein H0264_35140 [Nocardia huaxiensis]
MSDSVHDAVRTAHELFGPVAEVSATEFPSGALDLVIRRSGRIVVIQGLNGVWGVSVDISRGEEFTGHQQAFSSLDEALHAAKNSIDNPKASGAADSGSGWLTSRLNESTDSSPSAAETP